jgi:hypothetical protein
MSIAERLLLVMIKKRLWGDHKYNTDGPNIFYSSTLGASQFLKGCVHLLQRNWVLDEKGLGTSNLAIQFWEIYILILINQKSETVGNL